MKKPMAKEQRLTPKISVDGRSVFARGKDPGPIIWCLLLVPAFAFVIALVDTRLGFKLFMGSIGIAMLAGVIALSLRSRALRAGEICIETPGALRFIPPRSLWVGNVVVAFACLLPGAVSVIIIVMDLPTQRGLTKSTTVGPYVLVVIGLALLIQTIWSTRTPVGLSVHPEGLRGVRGTKRVDLRWDDIESVSPFGHHGPKLLLITANHDAIIIDSHHTGSDPAIVARVIEYFRKNPLQRTQLRDGAAAINIVETVDRSVSLKRRTRHVDGNLR